ncbi:MAG: S8 family peptidase, partial [Gammaproteobacteria bacterium]
PTPGTASRSNFGGGGGGDVIKPTPQQQWDRLAPVFRELRDAFEKRRVEIQQSASGIVPEQALVIETVGSIEDFVAAVKRIQGLEWMGAVEIDEITPNEEFYDKGKPDKSLKGRLYLVMTNQQALEQMLSLWREYVKDPTKKFKKGYTGFRNVFSHLKNLRRWGVEDKLHETGVLDVWREELEYDSDRAILCEVELWFRQNSSVREESENQVRALITQVKGRIISRAVIENIAYHGILVELPAQSVQSIVENSETELVKCEQIMFFRPVGQMVVGNESPEGDVEIPQIEETPLPTGDPIIALIDGLPLTNHRLLAGRVVVDDPDNFEADYEASERVHGSSMASLIIHGDLSQPQLPLSRPVYVRPIMKPSNWPTTPRPEVVPEDRLIVDLIHRAVKRLFEGDQRESPVAPQIKVINLSIGDQSRQFTHFISPLARLLDWLSVKYGVLFVVSAGNHPAEISLGVPKAKFDSFQADEFEAATIKVLYRDAWHRKILSPAETINGLTVGALHGDESTPVDVLHRLDPFSSMLPSPVSAFGAGYRNAIKPDMLFFGGRQLYEEQFNTTNVQLRVSNSRSAPGNKAASPGISAGELSATSFSCGTSNATALISRAAGICYDTLRQIFSSQADEIDPSKYEASLLKAMLIHGCSWADIGNHLKSQIENSSLGKEIKDRAESLYSRPADIAKEISRQYKSLQTRWMGYGIPDVSRVLDCTGQRATVLGYGQLTDGDAHVFSLPLPPSLESRHEWRRLTVTLAWLSPISVNTQRYRTASLWFGRINNNLASGRQNADWQAVRRGTVQHEVFEGKKAEPFIDGEAIKIKVNCRDDAGKIQNPVAYGLIVSLEVAEGIDIAVYDEIRTRITPAILIH